MMKARSVWLSLKGTSNIYMGSISPIPPWSRDSPYARFEGFVLTLAAKPLSNLYAVLLSTWDCNFIPEKMLEAPVELWWPWRSGRGGFVSIATTAASRRSCISELKIQLSKRASEANSLRG